MNPYNALPRTRNGLREKAVEISQDYQDDAVIVIVKSPSGHIRMGNVGLDIDEIRSSLLEAVDFSYKNY